MEDRGDGPRLARRRTLGLAMAGGVAAGLAACGSITAPTGSASGSAPSAPLAATSASGAPAAGPQPASTAAKSWLYLTILTGGMIGKKGWPTYVPANFSVPPNTVVQAEIRCFDDGAATIPSGYENVQGTTDGSMTVFAATQGDITQGSSQTVQSVAANNVAHTLTIADTGLNIPVPPLSTVRFTFNSGGAGLHGWQCMAACGTGTAGWAGPMATKGWMQGTLTVQA